MTKVEEVARAIIAYMDGFCAQTPYQSTSDWSDYSGAEQEAALLAAGAAIEALRMMTPAMDRAGHDAGILNTCDTSCTAMTDYRVAKIWAAMIDAALSE